MSAILFLFVLDAFLTECKARTDAFSTERSIPNGMQIFVRRLYKLSYPYRKLFPLGNIAQLYWMHS
jgi:hypothetical protein